MKTKSDVLSSINQLENDFKTNLERLKQDLFKVYETDELLIEFLKKTENHDSPDCYEFDESGTLCACFKIPFKLTDYPYFSEYYNLNGIGYLNKETGCVESPCGETITVNWNHSRNSYFIYDHETRKSIVEKKEDKPKEYYLARIEQYQRNRGVFGNVVSINWYDGSYIEHVTIPQEIINLNDAELTKFIEKYEINETE